MGAFDLDMSNPYAAGYDRSYGGPGQGGHVSDQWYIQYGMDLGAPGGTELRAVFDGHVTRLNTQNVHLTTGKVYGAELFMRSHNDGMGAFFTHLNDLPGELALSSEITRGQALGRVAPAPGSPHLHLALVEIVHGTYRGVDLYELFRATVNTADVFTVTFHQDGVTPPGYAGGGSTPDFGVLYTTAEIQHALRALGYPPGAVDSAWDGEMDAAVTQFQVHHGLDADGRVGPRTRAVLRTALAVAGLLPA